MNEYLRSGSLNLVNRGSLVTRQRWYVYSQKEVHLYGGSRLGIDETERPLMRVQVSEVWNPFNGTWCDPVAVQGQAREVWVNGAWVGENTPFPAPTYERFTDSTGKKRYELSNHLGNVLAVVSDRKLPQYQGNSGVIAYYEADQLSLKLYDPFGTIAQEWRITGTYRYSFNGKESDSEWDGGGAMFDYGFRIYDPRLGRFLSVDPLTDSYPWYTPYQFAGNMPIFTVDVDGLEPNYTLNENEKGAINDGAIDKSDGKEYTWTWTGDSWRRGQGVVDIIYTENESKHKAIETQKKYDHFDRILEGHIKYGIDLAKQRYKTAAGSLFMGYPDYVLDEGFSIGFNSYWRSNWQQDHRLPAHPSATGRLDLAPIQLDDILFLGYGIFKGTSSIFLRQSAARMISSCEAKAMLQLCFTSKTPIWCLRSIKRIEDIVIGDTVWSYDEVNKRYGLKKVVRTFKSQTNKLVVLYLSGDTIYTTPEHPFFVRESWISAKNLSVGDTLTSLLGEIILIQNIILKDTLCTVYNFEVENFHTYFVGNGILVHNTCNDIALGVRENLLDFTKLVNGVNWTKWGTTDFPNEFMAIISNPANTVHFNLTLSNGEMMNVWRAVTLGAQGHLKGGVTNWELFMIKSNPDVLKRTIFYHQGQVVPNPFD